VQLDQTTGALQAAQARAAELTERLAQLIEEQSGLRVVTAVQREELEVVRTELEEIQATVAVLSGSRGIYTVQLGDTLSSVAGFFYRSPNRWPDILAANSNLIEDPNLIFQGMVLIIPQ
jgi:nucleoid-associated protein YgaU